MERGELKGDRELKVSYEGTLIYLVVTCALEDKSVTEQNISGDVDRIIMGISDS